MTACQLINPVVNRWCREAEEHHDDFWARAAATLHWFRTWDRVFEWNFPTFRWFVGGQTNLAYNCLDYHVQRGWGGHTALIYVNERGDISTLHLRSTEARSRARRGSPAGYGCAER